MCTRSTIRQNIARNLRSTVTFWGSPFQTYWRTSDGDDAWCAWCAWTVYTCNIYRQLALNVHTNWIAPANEKRIEVNDIKVLGQILSLTDCQKLPDTGFGVCWCYQKTFISENEETIIFWSCDKSKWELPGKNIIQGALAGGRGRPRLSWMDNIKWRTDLGLVHVLRTTRDKVQWHKAIHSVTKPQIQKG